MNRILALARADFKNLKRDPLAGNLAIIPIVTTLTVMWLVPELTKWLMKTRGFDLTPYYTAIVSYFFVLIAPLQMGVMAGFLIMDEKDENILTALRVTPLPFLITRFTGSFLLCF